jgi:hypothetical protein
MRGGGGRLCPWVGSSSALVPSELLWEEEWRMKEEAGGVSKDDEESSWHHGLTFRPWAGGRAWAGRALCGRATLRRQLAGCQIQLYLPTLSTDTIRILRGPRI